MLTPLKRYADFDGRASRSEYWLFQLLLALLTIPFNALMTFALYDDSTGLTLAFAVLALLLLLLIALAVPLVAVTVRRLHDIDQSGWWVSVLFLPFVPATHMNFKLLLLAFILLLLVFMLLPGTRGENRFGPPVPHR